MFKENWKWSTGKMSSRRRRSRKQKIKQKRKRKTMVNAKRDEQKTKSDEKRMQETLDKKKECFSWEGFFFFFQKHGRFFGK